MGASPSGWGSQSDTLVAQSPILWVPTGEAMRVGVSLRIPWVRMV